MKISVLSAAAALFVCGIMMTTSCKEAEAEPEIESQWAGKKIAYLGDSITEPNQLSGHMVYWKALESILGTETYVYAVSGMQASHMPGKADKLLADHAQDVDAIMVLIGTNDFERSVPLGEWYTVKKEKTIVGTSEGATEVKRLHREFLYDNDTFRGRLNILLNKLKTTWPTKQIILLTPIHRAYAYYGDQNIQQDETWSNANGAFIDDFVNAVKEAGNVWAVPVIDLNSLCGLYPLIPAGEADPYFYGGNDSLHPNGDGHWRMAWTIATQLVTLPVIPELEGK